MAVDERHVATGCYSNRAEIVRCVIQCDIVSGACGERRRPCHIQRSALSDSSSGRHSQRTGHRRGSQYERIRVVQRDIATAGDRDRAEVIGIVQCDIVACSGSQRGRARDHQIAAVRDGTAGGDIQCARDRGSAQVEGIAS